METTKVSSGDRPMPTGDPTVTTVTPGMHRDRESIDDFEHVDRETSPVERMSKGVSEYEHGSTTQDLDLEYMPKPTESKVLESAIESDISGDLIAATKSLMDSSNDDFGLSRPTKSKYSPVGAVALEDFLRNEKDFMSSELNVDGSNGMKTENLIDLPSAAHSSAQLPVDNANFISSESTKYPDNEQHALGQVMSGGDSSLKTELGLGLPMEEDKSLEGFKTPQLFGDSLQDTLPQAKPIGLDTLKTEVLEPSEIFEVDTLDLDADGSEPSFALGLDPVDKDLGLSTGTVEPMPFKQQSTISVPTVPAVKPAEPTKKAAVAVKSRKEVNVDEITEPMELFCKMGLDAWFKPDRLHPVVVELVYWRDPKKSGVVFGSVLGILLSLSYFSLISVIAYLSFALLTVTIAYRIYKNIIQAVQKTSDGHPFKEILELDLTIPQDKVREMTDVTVTHLNAAALELRRLFLVEDLVDSIKFGVLLWCLTYLGSWFNGMTIIIIMFVAMFTLPKVYENNKSQIDQNLEIVRAKLAEVSAKVKAAVPIGKKPAVEEKKEQ